MTQLRERVRMLCLEEFESTWKRSWSAFAEGWTGYQMSGTHFEKMHRTSERLGAELTREFRRWAEKLWAFEHRLTHKTTPPMGRFFDDHFESGAIPGSQSQGVRQPPPVAITSKARQRTMARRADSHAFLWTAWIAVYGGAVNEVLDFKAPAVVPAELSQRSLLIIHLKSCKGCGFRGKHLSDRELAIISILDGNWPKGRRAPHGGFTASEIIHAEANAMKVARKRLASSKMGTESG